MPTTPEQVALVQSLIPSIAPAVEDAGGYGWDEAFIIELMDTNGLTPTEAVRWFWLERVNETSEYLDTGKPLTQIHRQAKEMLDYWDNILKLYGDSAIGPPAGNDPGAPNVPMTFGEIERVTG
jgi:hypothetical protein